ncbi:hypothetical protein QCA50_008128 [Cerrena zonata]|uniref:Uncharacterized protein n=1 Tax=Cerrena zonata TaxID=2478898 RepID=A0AAW0G529_9APHY
MFILTLLLLALWLHPLFAQDYSVPAQWTNTTSSLSREDRSKLAQRLLDTVIGSFDRTNGQISSMSVPLG